MKPSRYKYTKGYEKIYNNEDSPALPETSAALPGVYPGLSDACPGLSGTCPGLSDACPGSSGGLHLYMVVSFIINPILPPLLS
jgi:hypothetical protein